MINIASADSWNWKKKTVYKLCKYQIFIQFFKSSKVQLYETYYADDMYFIFESDTWEDVTKIAAEETKK